MNQRGEIDQIVTSIIVLFASFLLSFLFVIISTGAATVFGANTLMPYEVEGVDLAGSRVLGELFLRDTIKDAKGQAISVRDALLAIAQGELIPETDKLYREQVVALFNERYSCTAQNSFVYAHVKEKKINKEETATFVSEYVRYTLRAPDMGISVTSLYSDGKYEQRGFYGFSLSSSVEQDILLVKEVTRC